MIEFSVTENNLELTEIAQNVRGPLKAKLVERLTDVAYEAAFWGAPVKTGYLASTIYKQVTDNEGIVGFAASYAKFVVEGTLPHEIRAADGGVLSFMVAGKQIFTPIVHHPGTQPNLFLQNATEKARSQVEETFAELWLELVSD